MATRLIPFLLALVAALAVHAIGLGGIATQMKAAGSVLEERKDPLFTRTISATSAPAATPAPVIETPAAPTARPVVSVAPSKPAQPTVSVAAPSSSVALAETPTVTAPSESVSATVSETVAEPNQAVAPSTVTAAAPAANSQTLTAQLTGSTDSLLVTGEWPGDTRVNYNIGGRWGNELFGNGFVQWTRSGANQEKYQVKVVIDIPAVPRVTMTSQGQLNDAGLLPEAYEESVASRMRNVRLEASEIIFEKGNRRLRPASEPMSVQDTVSQFIDIGHRYKQGRAQLQAGQSIRIWLARPGNLDEWIYDVGSEEEILLPPFGRVKVHHLKPRPIANPRGTYSMEMWLAPSLQYLPVRIRMNINADSYVELSATQIQQK